MVWFRWEFYFLLAVFFIITLRHYTHTYIYILRLLNNYMHGLFKVNINKKVVIPLQHYFLKCSDLALTELSRIKNPTINKFFSWNILYDNSHISFIYINRHFYFCVCKYFIAMCIKMSRYSLKDIINWIYTYMCI